MKIYQKSALDDPFLESVVRFSRFLADLRLARRITQAQLAERAGVSRNTVSRIERGDPGVAFGQIIRILAALGRDDLFDRLVELKDPPVEALAESRKRQRARPLSGKRLDRYDF